LGSLGCFLVHSVTDIFHCLSSWNKSVGRKATIQQPGRKGIEGRKKNKNIEGRMEKEEYSNRKEETESS
jgi:hypothetical protein